MKLETEKKITDLNKEFITKKNKLIFEKTSLEKTISETKQKILDLQKILSESEEKYKKTVCDIESLQNSINQNISSNNNLLLESEHKTNEMKNEIVKIEAENKEKQDFLNKIEKDSLKITQIQQNLKNIISNEKCLISQSEKLDYEFTEIKQKLSETLKNRDLIENRKNEILKDQKIENDIKILITQISDLKLKENDIKNKSQISELDQKLKILNDQKAVFLAEIEKIEIQRQDFLKNELKYEDNLKNIEIKQISIKIKELENILQNPIIGINSNETINLWLKNRINEFNLELSTLKKESYFFENSEKDAENTKNKIVELKKEADFLENQIQEFVKQENYDKASEIQQKLEIVNKNISELSLNLLK